MRRALIIIGTVLTLLVLGTGVYLLFFRNTGDLVVAPTPNPSLPTGDGVTSPPATDPSPTAPVDVGVPATPPARLAQVSTGPVAASAVFVAVPIPDTASSTDRALRYLERKSGNIFHYNLRTGGITRTSNRTIPGILSAYWLPDGSTAYTRYLSGSDQGTINTYVLPAMGAEGFFLPQNISGFAVSSTSILTLTSGVNGSVGALAKPDGTAVKNVFTTPLAAVRASFAGKNYLVVTKPSATLAGAAFLVDAGGRFSRVAGPQRGLTAIASPSGTWLFVSFVQNGALQSTLVNTVTNESVSLPIATIADKCAWGTTDAEVYCGVPVDPSANFAYPDDWYQGAVSFSDRIWKIDVTGRYAQLVLDFKQETNTTLDAIGLTVEKGSTALSFINKTDGSLWVYQL